MIFLSMKCLMAAAMLGNASIHMALTAAEPTIEIIPLDDIELDVPVKIQWCWNALGIDSDDKVYAMYGGPCGDSVDCAVFQYDSHSGAKRFLGSAVQTLKAAGNWHPGEPVEKGHTHLPRINNRIYMGTQGFHFAAGANTQGMREALDSRGAHILAYDTDERKLIDISAGQPEGVFFQGRGFLALTDMPSHNLLVGLTVPHGDVLLYDVVEEKVKAIIPGVPELLGTTAMSREVVAMPNGKIFWMYSPLKKGDDAAGKMFVYDVNTGERSETAIHVGPEFWNGQAKSSDGKQVYLSDRVGNLFRVDSEADQLLPIGNIVPKAVRKTKSAPGLDFGIPIVQGIYLSADEKRLYAIASREMKPNPPQLRDNGKPIRFREPIGLFQFDLERRQSTEAYRFPRWKTFCYVTGSDVRDSQGNLYFALHAGRKGLMKISFPD